MRLTHIWAALSGAAAAAPLFSVAAHMAQRLPVPDNKWVRWLIDGVQFYFANVNKREDIVVRNAQDARSQP